MADNTVLASASGGDTLRTLDDGTVKWPVGVVAYATTVGTPDVLTIPVAAALADNTANPTTLLGGSCLMVFDGSTWDRAPGTTADGMLVNLGANNDVTITGTVTVASHAVTNAGTFATQATQAGTWTVTGAGGTFPVTDSGGSLTVDAPVGTPAFVRLSDGTSAIATLAVSLASVPSHAVTNAGTFPVQVDNTVTVGSHAVTNAGTFSVQVSSLAAGTNNIGDVDVLTVPADPFGVNADAGSATGSISAKLRFIAATGIPITGTVTVGSHAVTNAGTFATQSAAAGDIAHDSADSGNPVKVGSKAVATLSTQAMVAANDRANVFSDLDGAVLTRENTTLGDLVRGLAAITDGSSTSVIATPGAGVRLYITDIVIANSSASFVTVDIRDGTAGSVLITVPVPATGGVALRLSSPIAFTANTAAAADPSAAASTVTVTLSGFRSKI